MLVILILYSPTCLSFLLQYLVLLLVKKVIFPSEIWEILCFILFKIISLFKLNYFEHNLVKLYKLRFWIIILTSFPEFHCSVVLPYFILKLNYMRTWVSEWDHIHFWAGHSASVTHVFLSVHCYFTMCFNVL